MIKNLWDQYRGLFWEMLRFAIVGVISFILDTAVLVLVLRVVFNGPENPVMLAGFTFDSHLAIATAAGFALGVTVNYILSVLFVFQTAKEGKGRGLKAMILFLIIAVIGLILTEWIMHIGMSGMGFLELPVKIAATVIVTGWNYISRKLLIFKS